jgi:hypothetical protein
MKLIPKSWRSWDFTAFDGSQAVADFDISSWREKAILTVQSDQYSVHREGMMSGDFILQSAAGPELARAEKPSAFRRCFVIRHAGKSYTLRATSMRQFTLFDDSRKIGSISPDGFFTRRATVDLPDALPLPVRMFITWLSIILWKRDSDSA